jgi:hypothetical protein
MTKESLNNSGSCVTAVTLLMADCEIIIIWCF